MILFELGLGISFISLQLLMYLSITQDTLLTRLVLQGRCCPNPFQKVFIHLTLCLRSFQIRWQIQHLTANFWDPFLIAFIFSILRKQLLDTVEEIILRVLCMLSDHINDFPASPTVVFRLCTVPLLRLSSWMRWSPLYNLSPDDWRVLSKFTLLLSYLSLNSAKHILSP